MTPPPPRHPGAGRRIDAALGPAALEIAEALPPGAAGSDLRWHYPPVWLLALLPLGLCLWRARGPAAAPRSIA